MRAYVLRGLPEGSYARTLQGVRLLVGLEELGFRSRYQFVRWCSERDSGARPTLRKVKSGMERAARPQGGHTSPAPLPNASFCGPEHVLHVFKGTVSCRRRGHKVEPATGTLVTLDGRELRINANWCGRCGMYFLGHSEYMHYRSLHGPTLGNFRFEGSGYPAGEGFGALADESPLMLCGYSVSEAEGLSAGQRRLILANMMDRGICSKPRVIEYLQFFLRRRRN